MKLLNGDCLELMKDVPDGCIDMVLCDLPYGTMRGADLDGWDEKSTEWDNRLNDEDLFRQYERVLRKNGIAILFSQEPYTSKLRYEPKTNLEFCYPLIWKKDHFANPLVSHNAPVSYFEDLSVFHKRHDSQLLNPLREYFQKILDYIGVASGKEINKILGHRKAEHCFYVNTSQFSLCTEQTYIELINSFGIDKMQGFKTFSECKLLNNKFNEDFAIVFNIPNGKKFVGNILDFKKESKRFHPTQKPVSLLEYLIKIYTNEGDTVLDNCMGSGSTGLACVNTGRNFIGMELSEQYFEIAKQRIEGAVNLG